MKLTNAQRNKILARSLFVDAQKSFDEIAQVLNVTKKTIENYKIQDKKEGFDWLTLRATKHIKESNETKENMYSQFISYMYTTLKEIRESQDLNAATKAQMIVSLGDSFSKMGKVARQEDPEAYKYGIIKLTIEQILCELKNKLDSQSMSIVIDTIYELQERLADVTI